MTHLVNEVQLNKQLNSHREGEIQRDECKSRGKGRRKTERKLIFLCFVFSFPFVYREEVEEEYQPGPPVTNF